MSVVGTYTILATVLLSGDEIESNDSFTLEVENIGDGGCQELYSLPYLNDFNDGVSFVSCNTFVDADGDGNGWTQVSFSIDNGNPVADSQSYNGAILTPDNWIIMGPIDLSNVGSATLSWLVRGIDPAWCGENYSVYVGSSSDPADLMGGASSVVYNETIASGSDACGNTFAERSLDISAAAGGPVYIGFRHHDISDMFRLNIDDVSVDSEELGISDFENSELDYYYNSDSKELVLNSTQIMDEISIFNLLGQEVISSDIASQNFSIDLSNLSSSIYVVSVIADTKIKRFKLQVN